MSCIKPSLMDVIKPPVNPWLQQIRSSASKEKPPGVRIVRFGDDDDAEWLVPTTSATPTKSPAKIVREHAEA